jgi:hypothetical protein
MYDIKVGEGGEAVVCSAPKLNKGGKRVKSILVYRYGNSCNQHYRSAPILDFPGRGTRRKTRQRSISTPLRAYAQLTRSFSLLDGFLVPRQKSRLLTNHTLFVSAWKVPKSLYLALKPNLVC